MFCLWIPSNILCTRYFCPYFLTVFLTGQATVVVIMRKNQESSPYEMIQESMELTFPRSATNFSRVSSRHFAILKTKFHIFGCHQNLKSFETRQSLVFSFPSFFPFYDPLSSSLCRKLGADIFNICWIVFGLNETEYLFETVFSISWFRLFPLWIVL